MLNEKQLDFKKSKIHGVCFMINISEDDCYKKLKYDDDNVGTEAISEIIYELGRKDSWLSNR